VDLPEFVLNPYSIRLFNLAYYRGQLARGARRVEHYEPFFYPLDAVGDWNRIYGRSGFLQYQCLVPFGAEAAMHEILDCIARSGRNSFLTVLKTFGAIPSPGMMSFARPGITLALDFPNRAGIFELLATLDEIVVAAGGLVYPAKDARMSPRAFQTFYPRWEEFAAYVDPKFSSSFWRRVTAREG
jgi:FAD/FMN-containing dehydrogenase